MFKNYFKIAWRNLSKSKAYSAINIFGLAAGLSSFIIILLYLNYELSYDKWDASLKKVYRISLNLNNDIYPGTQAPLASFLKEKYPNVEAATATMPGGDYEVLLSTDNKTIYQKGMVTVDSLFLKVFPYKLVEGNAATALNQPNAVIISEELSGKLFGNEDPLGKTIKMYNSLVGVITGVMKKPSGPSHLNVEMLVRDIYERENKHWENYSYQTYVKLNNTVSEKKLEDDINRLYYNERLKKDNKSFEDYKKAGQLTSLFIDAVPNIHNFPKHGSSNFKTVSILLILAVLLLLAGAINFSNLAIARSMSRAKEVGVRKVLGSARKQLILQFMSETALQCLISLCIAALMVFIALPYINSSFNIKLNFWQQDNTVFVIAQIALCLLIVTLLSGLYPSLFLSRFNTTKVLKGDYSSGQKGRLFRNSLIVVQFMVSAFFIVATLVISSQMHYMQTKDKGFSDAQVMRIMTTQKTREAGFSTTKNTLLSVSGVSQVAKTTKVPGDKVLDTSTFNFKYEGKEFRLASVKISTDYFNTLHVPLVQGRLFTDDNADQNTRTAIINEAGAEKLHLDNPIGKFISFAHCDSVPVEIVGVVKNFNVLGYENEVQPMVYTIGNKACLYQSGGAILVKLNSNHMQQSVADIEQAWKNIEPGFPIRYSFLDDNFQQLFLSYVRLQKVIGFFAVIAILISAMGLFALTAFFTKQRTKEIGVRKILGASVTHLVSLLSKELISLVLLSVLIITPVAWWAMHKWLQTFAYRINISWWMFIAAGGATVCIALLTVSFQAIKAAIVNPVKNLRTE
ncbi:MAG: ABC transporter permease [Chitinophagaceae bacterium]